MNCLDMAKRLQEFTACEVTDEGLCITTQCLYPSFIPVKVFVVGFGSGYKVHDGGGAAKSAWDHGRDDAVLHRAMNHQADAHHLQIINNVLVGEVDNADWLMSSILAVANASGATAQSVVMARVQSSENELKAAILAILRTSIPRSRLTTDAEIYGKSGKRHRFDFVVELSNERRLLIEAVSPHHVSVSAKYVAFSDAGASGGSRGFAVYDRELEVPDASLIKQVADLVPVRSLQSGLTREAALH